MSKREYEASILECWALDTGEPDLSVKECLDLELETIYNALEGHDDDEYWLGRLRDYMVYQVVR